MKEDETLTAEEWLEFVGAMPEDKVDQVEKCGKTNITQEELNEQRDRLVDMLNITFERLWIELYELAERIEIVEDKIQGILSDD